MLADERHQINIRKIRLDLEYKQTFWYNNINFTATFHYREGGNMMENDFEEFTKFRCREILLNAGIDLSKINMDACVSSYKEGFTEALKISSKNKTSE